MACCALAVFLIGQIYILCEAVARWLGFAIPEVQRAGAADWRLGGAATIVTPRLRFGHSPWHRIGLAITISAAALLVFRVFQPNEAAFLVDALMRSHTHWCFAGRI